MQGISQTLETLARARHIYSLTPNFPEIFNAQRDSYLSRNCSVPPFYAPVFSQIKAGGHPPKEVSFHDNMYSLMESCWKMIDHERPRLASIKEILLEIQQEQKNSGEKKHGPHDGILFGSGASQQLVLFHNRITI